MNGPSTYGVPHDDGRFFTHTGNDKLGAFVAGPLNGATLRQTSNI